MAFNCARDYVHWRHKGPGVVHGYMCEARGAADLRSASSLQREVDSEKVDCYWTLFPSGVRICSNPGGVTLQCGGYKLELIPDHCSGLMVRQLPPRKSKRSAT